MESHMVILQLATLGQRLRSTLSAMMGEDMTMGVVEDVTVAGTRSGSTTRVLDRSVDASGRHECVVLSTDADEKSREFTMKRSGNKGFASVVRLSRNDKSRRLQISLDEGRFSSDAAEHHSSVHVMASFRPMNHYLTFFYIRSYAEHSSVTPLFLGTSQASCTVVQMSHFCVALFE